MKKRKLKKWVKGLMIIVVVYVIGLIAVLSLCDRAEQINNQYNNTELKGVK